jgi:hypothetical protein
LGRTRAAFATRRRAEYLNAEDGPGDFMVLNHPFLVLGLSLLAFWGSARIGASFAKMGRDAEKEARSEDFALISATLTLLGLLIGFSFSMALNRYDQRKNCEEDEANAIGTEYLRLDMLPSIDATRVRVLLRGYLEQRILYYKSRDEEQLQRINDRTAQIQNEMWSLVAKCATAERTPVSALALSGMNDILNSQGYTQAAWWNRVPTAAWILVVLLSIFSNLLVGYATQNRSAFRFFVLPISLSISIFLMADIDSPRGGIIHVQPQNLEHLAGSVRQDSRSSGAGSDFEGQTYAWPL